MKPHRTPVTQVWPPAFTDASANIEFTTRPARRASVVCLLLTSSDGKRPAGATKGILLYQDRRQKGP
jgi:hypothetical protein